VLACALYAGACGRVGFGPVDDSAATDARPATTSDGDTGDSDSTQTETVTLPAVADTAINSFATSLNYGAATAFNIRDDAVSTFTGLVRFDLSSVAGSVTAATLRLSTSNQAIGAGRIEIARVREAWDEGTANGGAGVANHTLRQGAATMWTTAGCGPGSRDTTSIAELQPVATNTTYDVSLPAALVETWVVDPASNHGLALFAVGTGSDTVTFFSRESAMGPALVVEIAR